MKEEILILKTKQELHKLKYKVENFEEIWSGLEPEKLDRMSANQLAKTVFFRSVTKDIASNYAFSVEAFNMKSKPDQFETMRTIKKIKEEINGKYE